MKRLWQRIERWFADNVDSSRFSVPDGATQEDIERAEAALGIGLPSDVRKSYLLHDGSNRIWLWPNGYLMPLFPPAHLSKRKQRQFRPVVASWQNRFDILESGGWDDLGCESNPVGPIRTDHWHVRWIPILDNYCGDAVCVDLAPAKGGKRGQIIEWDHEVGATQVLAEGFREFLEQIANQLEGGSLRFVDKVAGSLEKVDSD
jgi:cell wall assembly regulator SMI1